MVRKFDIRSDMGSFASGAGVGVTPALAVTGLGAISGVSAVWLFVAAFTLVAAGFAILRIMPRRES